MDYRGGQPHRRDDTRGYARQVSGTARIVVVEDDASVAQLVTLYLRNAGYIVEHAATGERARALFDEVKPALVVLDLGLPDADGVDLFNELRVRASTQLIEEVDAVRVGQPEVEHDERGLHLVEEGACAFAGRRVLDDVAGVPQVQRDQLRHRRVVLDDDDPRSAAHPASIASGIVPADAPEARDDPRA